MVEDVVVIPAQLNLGLFSPDPYPKRLVQAGVEIRIPKPVDVLFREVSKLTCRRSTKCSAYYTCRGKRCRRGSQVLSGMA